MKIVEFKAPLTMAIDNKQIKIKPKHMYLFADVIQMSFKKRLIEIITNQNKGIEEKYIESLTNRVIKYDKDIEDILTRFNIKDIKKKKIIFPIVLRTGGIGDLIALSSISYYVPKMIKKDSQRLKFVSQEKYRSVFKQYKKPITFVSYFAPIAKYHSNSSIDKKRINGKFKPIFFEGVIENSKENQFNLQFSTIGLADFKEEQGRPHLTTKRISNEKSNIDLSKKSVLINCRSTAIIRSMRFQDIYESLIKLIGDLDINIYIHRRNIRPLDQEFIDQVNDDRIKIINAENLNKFFLDVFDATLSISVDTAQFHFREGIEKPAVGLYGPFPYECRTKYYKYTLSMNIESKCPNMPCFIHVKSSESICDFQQNLIDNNQYDDKWRMTAPCCCNEQNTTVQDQIVNKCGNYILDILK